MLSHQDTYEVLATTEMQCNMKACVKTLSWYCSTQSNIMMLIRGNAPQFHIVARYGINPNACSFEAVQTSATEWNSPSSPNPSMPIFVASCQTVLEKVVPTLIFF